MIAFLSNQSALEALRHLGNETRSKPRWPQAPRRLPRWGDCVSKQLEFKAFCAEVDLPSFGVATSPVDLLVPAAGERSRGKRASFHVWQHPIPAASLLRIDENLFASSPEFVLLQMAAQNAKSGPLIDQFLEEQAEEGGVLSSMGERRGHTYDDPLAWARKERLVRMALVACEFSGSYRLAAGEGGAAYRLLPLMSCDTALNLANSIPHLYGASRVRSALGFAFDRSASPMETALALMLTLPLEYGGYGLPRPSLNEALPTGEFASLWSGGDWITPDLLWRDAMLVIEYESSEFHASLGSSKATDDAIRANVLSAMGYAVLRATAGSVASLRELDRLALQVAAKLGLVLRPSDELTLIRRRKLHALLMHQ